MQCNLGVVCAGDRGSGIRGQVWGAALRRGIAAAAAASPDKKEHTRLWEKEGAPLLATSYYELVSILVEYAY
jgi:hypothetical protein